MAISIQELRDKAEKLFRDKAGTSEYSDMMQLIHEMELQSEALRQAQAEIDTLRQRYMDLYLLAPVGYLIIDANGQILDMNIAAVQMLQDERRCATGSIFSRYLSPESRPPFYQMLNSLKTSDAPHTLELTALRQVSQTAMHLRVIAQAYYDDDQLRARLTMIDITDRIEVEKNLRESEARFRQAVIDAPEPIMVYAEDGAVILLSRCWVDYTGYDLQDIPTIVDWLEMAYGVRRPFIQTHIAEFYAIGASPEGTAGNTIRTRDGIQRIWEFSASPLGPLPDGRQLTMIVGHDITERRHNELKLQQSEAKHRDIAENLPGVIFQFVIRADGAMYFEHLSGSDDTAGKFGFSIADILADPTIYFNAIVPEDLITYSQVLQESAQNMTSYSIEFRLQPPGGGDVIWLNARATPKHLPDTGIIWTGIALDITERKAAEIALKQLTSPLPPSLPEDQHND